MLWNGWMPVVRYWVRGWVGERQRALQEQNMLFDPLTDRVSILTNIFLYVFNFTTFQPSNPLTFLTIFSMNEYPCWLIFSYLFSTFMDFTFILPPNDRRCWRRTEIGWGGERVIKGGCSEIKRRKLRNYQRKRVGQIRGLDGVRGNERDGEMSWWGGDCILYYLGLTLLLMFQF